MSTIGDRLKEVREAAGLSQTAFGDIGGVGKHSQINYEKGAGAPDSRYLQALYAKGYDVSYILTGIRRAVFTVEENQPQPYTPSQVAAHEISGLNLSKADAEILVNLAKRLSSG